jgi:hypothetical protein
MPNLKHGAYRALRLATEGRLPSKRTRIGKALQAVELRLRDHFNGFNDIQEVHFSTILLPHILFLLEHPMVNSKGKLSSDWKWVSNKVEKGYEVLVKFGNSEKTSPVPDLEVIIAEAKAESESEKPESVGNLVG